MVEDDQENAFHFHFHFGSAGKFLLHLGLIYAHDQRSCLFLAIKLT